MKNNDLVVLGILALAGIILIEHCRKPSVPEIGKIIAEGRFSHAEYVSRHSKSYSYTSRRYETDDKSVTVIHMDDGRQYLIASMQDMPFAKGENILILEFSSGCRSIEKVGQ